VILAVEKYFFHKALFLGVSLVSISDSKLRCLKTEKKGIWPELALLRMNCFYWPDELLLSIFRSWRIPDEAGGDWF
jgi:hypothetical protein